MQYLPTDFFFLLDHMLTATTYEQERGSFQMKNVLRAWKDEAYRQDLPTEEQAILSSNRVDEIELTDAELETAYGAGGDECWEGGNAQIGLINIGDLL
jgi:mersacidin/lichenicidin family type 2 lantibiotic